MGRTHDVLISEFDLDRLEADLAAAERAAAEQTRRANENHAWALRAERERDVERALADRLADCLNNLWHHHSLTEASYDYIDEALAAWKEARSE
jgi:1,6-anhydro-N-acetylmuramate kinase